MSDFDPPFLSENGQYRAKISYLRKSFSHWAIQVRQKQDPISSTVSGKNIIIYCSVWAIFWQETGRGHTLESRNQSLSTLLQCRYYWAA